MIRVYKFLNYRHNITFDKYDSSLHQCIPLTKTAFINVHNKYKFILNKTMCSRFRQYNNIWIIGLIYSLSINIEKRKLFNNEQIYTLASQLNKLSLIHKFINNYYNNNTKLICLNNINSDNNHHKYLFKEFIYVYIYHLKKYLNNNYKSTQLLLKLKKFLL